MATTPTPPYDPNPEELTEPTLSRKVVSAAEELRDIKGVLQRCLRVPAGETATQLPIAHARKGGLLGFDASTGQPVVLDVQGELVGVPGPQGPAGIPGAPGIPGSDGVDGAPGADGRTTQFHVAYANSADGTVGFNQFNGVYIGTYVDFVSQDSTNPADYRWRLFQGAQGPQGLQGIPGVNGATGATTYLHLKYSNDGGVTFTANTGENPGAYVGVYHDSTEADSANPTSYTWTKIQGDPGAQGQPGAQGPQGQAGVPGAPGTPGVRGATTAWAATSGTSWNSAEADAAIAASGYGAPQTIDRVTLVNSAAGYVETRYRAGVDWIPFSQVIDGNLIIPGTIAASTFVGKFAAFDILEVGTANALLVSAVASATEFPALNGPGDYVEIPVVASVPAQSAVYPAKIDLELSVKFTWPAGTDIGACHVKASVSGSGTFFTGLRHPLTLNITTRQAYGVVHLTGVGAVRDVDTNYSSLVEFTSRTAAGELIHLPASVSVTLESRATISVNKV